MSQKNSDRVFLCSVDGKSSAAALKDKSMVKFSINHTFVTRQPYVLIIFTLVARFWGIQSFQPETLDI